MAQEARPIGEAFRLSEPLTDTPDAPNIDEPLEQRLKKAGFESDQIQTVVYGEQALRQQGIDPAPVPKGLRTAIESRLAGGIPYTDWLEARLIEERPAPTTERRWRTTMKELAGWLGSDYLSPMTKVEAGQHKRHLMQRLADSSTKTNINYIKAF